MSLLQYKLPNECVQIKSYHICDYYHNLLSVTAQKEFWSKFPHLWVFFTLFLSLTPLLSFGQNFRNWSIEFLAENDLFSGAKVDQKDFDFHGLFLRAEAEATAAAAAEAVEAKNFPAKTLHLKICFNKNEICPKVFKLKFGLD